MTDFKETGPPPRIDLLVASGRHREALELDSCSVPALAGLRAQAAAEERWEEAADYARRELALLQDPVDQLPLLLEIGQIHHLFLGDPDAAQEALEEALVLDEGNLAATSMLAELYFQQGEWELAAHHTVRQLRRGAGAGGGRELYFRLGFAQEKLGKMGAALANYLRAHSEAPGFLPVLERLVQLCYRRRQWEDSLHFARLIIDRHSASKSEREVGALWLRVSLCELHLAQREVARRRLQEMAGPMRGTHQSLDNAWQELADRWAAREMDPRLLPGLEPAARWRVVRAAGRCLELWPDHPDAHQMLAAMAIVVRDWPTALEEMEKAASSEALPEQQRAQIWNFSGEVAMRQKLAPMLARSCFKRSLALDPDQPDVARKVKILCQKTVPDASLGMPPQWESEGVPSRLQWLTRPPVQEEEAFDAYLTTPFAPEEKKREPTKGR